MKKVNATLLAVALGLAACADSAPDETSNETETQEVGKLSLNLTGSDTDGRQYRLRNGVFSVQGSPEYPFPGMPPSNDAGAAEVQIISTETNPDAPVITLTVIPGFYYVNLQSADWYLERLTDGAWARVQQSVLLSSSSQFAYVYNGGVTRVAFRFGVDGQLIDFRSGELQVGIEIEQPGEGPGYDAGGLIGGLFGGMGGGIGGGVVDAGMPPEADAGAGGFIAP